MIPGGGKAKGSEFERWVGQRLSLWISNQQRNDLVTRTVLSGGQWTASGDKQRGSAGDLTSNHPDAHPFFERFVVECKHWAWIDLVDFCHQKGELYTALEKVQREAAKCKRLWMLVAKQNRRADMLFMPAVFDIPLTIDHHYHELFRGTVYMFRFDEFIKEVPYIQIMELTLPESMRSL